MKLLIFIAGLIIFYSCQNRREVAYTNDNKNLTKYRDSLKSKPISYKDSIYKLNSLRREKATSASFYDRITTANPIYTFPFKWEPEMDDKFLPILRKDESYYTLFIFGYALPSTSSNKYETYGFTYSKNGDFIDLILLLDFYFEKPDQESFLKSIFYKEHNWNGFSLLQVIGNKIENKTQWLKVYTNKSEEIYTDEMTCEINPEGQFLNHKTKRESFIYSKRGELTSQGKSFISVAD